MTEETKPVPPTEKTTPAKPAKKAKPPALEDKPFPEFMTEHFLPSLKTALTKEGLENVQLDFKQDQVTVAGFETNPKCWQVVGKLNNRQFNLYYLDGTLTGQKAFSCTTDGKKPSTLESFMIDERKVTLDLMVLFTLKRLNGQKWLGRN
jgi:hypothetical protein